MTYFNQFKNATRKTKRLLVLFALLFGFSANAATYKVSDTPVDPSTLAPDAKVVMYHNGTGKLVGCQDGKEVTKDKDSKEITDAYVFTVKKDGNKIALQNGVGYVPQVTAKSGLFSVDFSFAWATSVANNYYTVDVDATTPNVIRLYVEGKTSIFGTVYKGYLNRTNNGMGYVNNPSNNADWTFYQVTDGSGSGSGSGSGDGDATVHNQLKAWQTNAGYQEVGYIGLGNKNQVLAMACVSVSADDVPTLTYRLFGHTGYLSAISVYARKRDTGQDYTTDKDDKGKDKYASFENTFAHIFDYRNPEKNCGALFLGTTHEVPAAGKETTFTSNLKLPEGEYVIYLVANVRSAEEIGGLKNLPLIGGAKANYTRVGGVIDQVSNKTINTVNNYSGEGGGRVLVPKFKLLYAPRYENFATSEELCYPDFG